MEDELNGFLDRGCHHRRRSGGQSTRLWQVRGQRTDNSLALHDRLLYFGAIEGDCAGLCAWTTGVAKPRTGLVLLLWLLHGHGATCSLLWCLHSPQEPHWLLPSRTVAHEVGSSMEHIGVDVLRSSPTTASGKHYEPMAMDYFTKWSQA